MTCSALAPIARGMFDRGPDIDAASSPTDRVGAGAARPVNPLERLAQIVRSNDRLMAELAGSRERIDRARAYLDSIGANLAFGSAHLDRCRAKHSAILATLRANRIEALTLLAGVGPEGSAADLA